MNAISVLAEENIAPNFVFEPIVKWISSEMDSFKTEDAGEFDYLKELKQGIGNLINSR